MHVFSASAALAYSVRWRAEQANAVSAAREIRIGRGRIPELWSLSEIVGYDVGFAI